MTDKAMSEREAFEACLASGVFDDERVSDFCDCETEAAWRGFQAGRASLAASAGSVVDVSDGPGCVMHRPTADEIDKLRDEARRLSRAGVEWMRIEEHAEVLANVADLALAGLAASAGPAQRSEWVWTRSLLITALWAFGGAPDNERATEDAARAVDAITEPGSPLAWLRNAAPMTASAGQAEPTDAEILALNEGERYFSETPTRFPKSGNGTQYHCGAPGLLAFARAVRALNTATPMAADQTDAAADDNTIFPASDMRDAAVLTLQQMGYTFHGEEGAAKQASLCDIVAQVRRECIRSVKYPGAIIKQAAKDVLAERARQVSVEGWTPEHDDRYVNGELAMAAASYASESITSHGGMPSIWPWDASWWKPGDRRRMLEKAGALIIAEIERLDRAEGKS
jgi:hypothetical protein